MTFSIDNKVVHDPKVIKILQKDITKRILDCFNDEPKTASQIANSISFPKDKIYYHIKNLIAFDNTTYKCGSYAVLVPSVLLIFLFKFIY